MKVKHYMTKDVFTVTSDVKITDAVDIMEGNNFHRLPVVENNQFIGLITEELIAKGSPSKVSSLSIYEMNYLFDKVLVKDLMKTEVITISDDIHVEEAAVLMAEKDITVLPVVNDTNEVIGIITHKDIFKALIQLTGYQEKGARVVVETKEDRIGVIAEISNALAQNEINLSHIFVNRPDDVIEITLQTSGKEPKAVKELIERLGYRVIEVIL
ncbi:MAG TPA: CBS domain-containing protein [Atopostipes sp.]|nr:CBS domain-containing protein [Atopostipes sp.]